MVLDVFFMGGMLAVFVWLAGVCKAAVAELRSDLLIEPNQCTTARHAIERDVRYVSNPVCPNDVANGRDGVQSGAGLQRSC